METIVSGRLIMNIPIAKPTMTGDEMELIQQALTSGWVSMGPLTQQFEQEVCKFTGARHAVAMNSCTSAIHVAMLIHGIGAGHEVICPSYSFIASANGIRHAGAEPVFADIDPATLTLDPVHAEALIHENYDTNRINRKTGRVLRAIHLVHQLGIPADIDAFAALAEKYNLILIEDNACGLGSTYKHQPLGLSGFTNTLSFHPRKVITTGEGGMLLTRDADLAAKAGVYRAHGMSISDFTRHNANATTYESYEVVGYNYRLTDIQAAIGLKQMAHLEGFIQRRREIADIYNQAFTNEPRLSIIAPPAYVTRWNYQSYPLRLVDVLQAKRDAFMLALQEAGITTRRGIPPIHQESVYQQGLQLPQTEQTSQTSLMLPIFPLMTNDEVHYVVENVLSRVKQLL
jgi:perosamine synthetase